MRKVKTIEFWLVALPVLLVAAAWAAGFDNFKLGKNLILPIAILWCALAILWMLREIFRKFRNWGEE